MAEPARGPGGRRYLIVLKGYPRVSETFIAQEILGLQTAGLVVEIVSLRRPYDPIKQPIHNLITAPVLYLPERFWEAPGRILRAFFAVVGTDGFWKAARSFWREFRHDRSQDRALRFCQALVLAAERPVADGLWIYAHFAHTPTSVARYAADMLGVPFSISAHAKDIWTTPDRELAEKLAAARWTVTCTEAGLARLKALAPGAEVHLLYHGLDLDRFAPFAPEPVARDGSDPGDPVRILSVGRAVPKKGYDTVLEALAALPGDLHWRFEHIGRGPELERLQAKAAALGIAERVDWLGQRDQDAVLEAYRRADLFVLASHSGADRDRDGLPNVIVEAASQGVAVVATAFSAIPELIEDEVTGCLVPIEDAGALAAALERCVREPDLRQRIGRSAEDRVRTSFDFRPGIARLVALLEG